ncbi:DoxX family protein [Nocardia cyriacigeorgica]|uniref:DoxX family protein n=1 Tax=Nocardia cyriacigeorgica TaxID=135487 RepID=A0A5R8P8S6_9NOCA|nr:DoxX family protein [Nocardia cyriacigeorgica]TLF97566.1 DoxX family protein [Nocardia cyriacigeorgica]
MNGIDVAAGVLRLTLGTIMLVHGLGHAFAGGKLSGTARWFDDIGLRPGRVHAVAATVTEAGAGVLLLLGAATPLAAAAVVATMLVAFVTSHRRNGFFIYNPGQGWEYVAVLGMVALALAAVGPGRWSIDQAVGFSPSATLALGITAGAGVLAATALLAAAWRPQRNRAGAQAVSG